MNIFSGDITALKFRPKVDDEVDAFVDPGKVGTEGPTFSVRALNYFEGQTLFDDSLSEIDKIRAIVTLGLVDIDGDASKAAKFIESPNARLFDPLFKAIQGATWGN